MDDVSKQTLINALKVSISSDRLATYLKAAGFDDERGLNLYLWNATVGEAFHLPIQAVEVGLRNCINFALCAEFGFDWWKNTAFLTSIDRERSVDISTAERRIRNRNHVPVTSQVVATLSFGFWVGMLQPRFNPTIWSKHIRTAFLDLPDQKGRSDLAASAKRTADLRNRIWHHEPIFRENLSDEFRSVMELLAWICPAKASWIKPSCRVLALLRQKP
jgi:hypothetical protein